MPDPHVVWLKYRLKTDETVSYKAPALTYECDQFSLRLDEQILMIEMKQHFSSVGNAKAELDDFLQSWELHVALEFGLGELQFIYEEALVVDRDPLRPDSPQEVHLSGEITSISTVSATLHIERSLYPEPPKRFKASPDAEVMWLRYQQHLEGKEPVQAMGYFCLSLMEWSTGPGRGKRFRTANQYRICKGVLDHLGKLTCNKGTKDSARKLSENSTLEPLSDSEVLWIHAAVKKLIHRKGEYDFDPSAAHTLDEITLDCLPKL